jgi:hypothetical protein
MEIRPLTYDKQYYSWELVCHSVKSQAQDASPMRTSKSISECVLYMMRNNNNNKVITALLMNGREQINF